MGTAKTGKVKQQDVEPKKVTRDPCCYDDCPFFGPVEYSADGSYDLHPMCLVCCHFTRKDMMRAFE